MDSSRTLVAVVGLCLASCTMDNPAFDPHAGQETRGSDEGVADSSSEGKEGEAGDGDGDAGDGEAGDGDGDGDGDGEGEGDGDGDPGECLGLMVTGPCPECISANCCVQVEACLSEFGCQCMVNCLFLEGNPEELCIAECTPDPTSQTLLGGLSGCIAQICFEACTLP